MPPNSLSDSSETWAEIYQRIYNNSFDLILDKIISGHCFRCNRKKGHTAKCMEVEKALEKKRQIENAKNVRRRAKKITMTVGEYEDALEEAERKYYFDEKND